MVSAQVSLGMKGRLREFSASAHRPLALARVTRLMTPHLARETDGIESER